MADKDEILAEIDKVELEACEGRGPTGWVYFIVCPDTSRCKIGFTKGQPEKRLAGLQTGSPSQLCLISMHPGTPETERRLHDRFAADRLHGEWFQLSHALRAYIVVSIWAMSEITIKSGQKLKSWMVMGCDLSITQLGTISESLADLLEADLPE